ncbi:hypothetical protein GCM10010515_18480 [Streptomyces fructofermentans]|uniref:Uncharacterized protein n=1 Tax=Streptomyces fructofermentans TaxID=152141 RepID=A0A918K661_9ACTN|nr:hypothetical protein GCM10010515_18480 [Streptomyces fructofermentans]
MGHGGLGGPEGELRLELETVRGGRRDGCIRVGALRCHGNLRTRPAAFRVTDTRTGGVPRPRGARVPAGGERDARGAGGPARVRTA